MEYVNLEIALSSRERDVYTVAVRWQPPGSLVDEIAEPGVATFDWAQLREYTVDSAKHGRALAESLFADNRVSQAFSNARVASEVQKAGLRLRLFIHRAAPELHDLRWETLRDPDQPERVLLTNELILFSRYLSSLTARTVAIRRKQERPRALVVVANTIAAGQKGQAYDRVLDPVQVDQEIERAKSGLGEDFDIDILASDPGYPGRVTLEAIIEKLRDSYDVFYLVCHGALASPDQAKPDQRRNPILLLEAEGGGESRARGDTLVNRIADLREQPRLVVLASCQSAGDAAVPEIGDEGALAALGPRMVESGVPAVIAMQGNVTMETAGLFLPYFFQRLREHGEVDLAVAEARSRIQGRPDFWAPVLFSRLREGRIWYEPRFDVGPADQPQRWQTIQSSIKAQKCLPILGSGLTERLFGSASDMARIWAGREQFPLAERYAEELPQVAQYVLVTQDPGHLIESLTEYWQEKLKKCIPAAPPPNEGLAELVKLVGVHRRNGDPSEPHRLLARLQLPIYVTANQDTWMEDAIRENGAVPTVEYFRWKPELRRLPPRYNDRKNRSSAANPLVYHLFGTIEEPRSLVLTEDDYFEFLISIANGEGKLPREVDTAWSTHVLLFLGFSLTDWHFRLMFHSILDANRRAQRFESDTRAVAVQISPDEGVQQPRRAQYYFQRYFTRAVTDMYIGRADDFVKDLWLHAGKGDE